MPHFDGLRSGPAAPTETPTEKPEVAPPPAVEPPAPAEPAEPFKMPTEKPDGCPTPDPGKEYPTCTGGTDVAWKGMNFRFR